MASHLELNSRAALCRRLAAREPSGKAYWLAEAESWSRLSRQSGRAVVTEGAALNRYRGHATSYPRIDAKSDPFEQLLGLMAAEDVR